MWVKNDVEVASRVHVEAAVEPVHPRAGLNVGQGPELRPHPPAALALFLAHKVVCVVRDEQLDFKDPDRHRAEQEEEERSCPRRQQREQARNPRHVEREPRQLDRAALRRGARQLQRDRPDEDEDWDKQDVLHLQNRLQQPRVLPEFEHLRVLAPHVLRRARVGGADPGLDRVDEEVVLVMRVAPPPPTDAKPDRPEYPAQTLVDALAVEDLT